MPRTIRSLSNRKVQFCYHVGLRHKSKCLVPSMTRKERIVFWFLIHDVSRLRRTAFDKRMRPLGITRSQWSVLARISSHGDHGITQTELAGILDLGKVALGGLVDRLETGGFVQRRADANDRRINRVFLTSKGNVSLELMTQVAVEMNAIVMKGISVERQHMLSDTLSEMKVNLLALDTVPGSKTK